MEKVKNVHAVALGRLGGSVKSARKTEASRRNAYISAMKRRGRKQAKRTA